MAKYTDPSNYNLYSFKQVCSDLRECIGQGMIERVDRAPKVQMEDLRCRDILPLHSYHRNTKRTDVGVPELLTEVPPRDRR